MRLFLRPLICKLNLYGCKAMLFPLKSISTKQLLNLFNVSKRNHNAFYYSYHDHEPVDTIFKYTAM